MAEADVRQDVPGLGVGFWRLWTSSGLSNVADGIVKVALPLIAIRFTNSPTMIAGLAFALTLPWLLFALPAGALADRVDRRRAMLGANTVRAALLAVLALAAILGVGSIWLLYAVALCIGIAETIYDTSAQSLLPLLVPRERLSRANGRLHAVELTANLFIGPPLGGLLVAAGAALAFATPAGLWAAAVGALLLVRGRFRIERDRRTTMRADVAEGLRFLWRHRLLRTLAVMVGVSNFATNATFVILVLYLVGPTSAVRLSEPAYGLLLTTIAAGSLLGALAADRVERWLGRARSLALTILGIALVPGVVAMTTNAVLIGAALFAEGAAIAIWNVVTVSLRQRVTPRPAARARQQRLPVPRVGHHAGRCRGRRPAGPGPWAARGVRHHGAAHAHPTPRHDEDHRRGHGRGRTLKPAISGRMPRSGCVKCGIRGRMACFGCAECGIRGRMAGFGLAAVTCSPSWPSCGWASK